MEIFETNITNTFNALESSYALNPELREKLINEGKEFINVTQAEINMPKAHYWIESVRYYLLELRAAYLKINEEIVIVLRNIKSNALKNFSDYPGSFGQSQHEQALGYITNLDQASSRYIEGNIKVRSSNHTGTVTTEYFEMSKNYLEFLKMAPFYKA